MQTNHIKNIAIVGAGAMGAAYAAMFADTGAFSPFFLADGERYRRFMEKPLRVNWKTYSIPVMPLTGPETTILSVMNGLESEEMARPAVSEKLVYAIAVGIDAVREGDIFTYARPGRIIFGEGTHKAVSGRVVRLREALSRAAIPHEVPADMMRIMW